MTEPPARLNEAAAFRATLQQTIAEGIQQMTGQPGFAAGYKAFLEAAGPRLLEARDADFGAHNHDFITESLAEAARSLGKPPGAWQARIFLTGFAEGVCDMAHRLSRGPLPDGPVSPLLIHDAIRGQASFVASHFADDGSLSGQAHRLLAGRLSKEERASRDYLMATKRQANPSDVRVAFYEALRHAIHGLLARRKGERWLAACEEAHLRLRSFIAGGTSLLEVVHPGTAMDAGWAHAVKTGRITQAQAQDCWWFRSAVGRLAALRSRTFWRPGPLDGYEAALELCIRTAKANARDSTTLQTKVTAEADSNEPDLCRRVRQWICGAQAGSRRAQPLPAGSVEAAWASTLLADWEADMPALAPLLEGIDTGGVDDGSCGHDKAHALRAEILRRLAASTGCDPVLPERSEVAYAFGFVEGHHWASLHGAPQVHGANHEPTPPPFSRCETG